jgi:hypothetical protein
MFQNYEGVHNLLVRFSVGKLNRSEHYLSYNNCQPLEPGWLLLPGLKK